MYVNGCVMYVITLRNVRMIFVHVYDLIKPAFLL